MIVKFLNRVNEANLFIFFFWLNLYWFFSNPTTFARQTMSGVCLLAKTDKTDGFGPYGVRCHRARPQAVVEDARTRGKVLFALRYVA